MKNFKTILLLGAAALLMLTACGGNGNVSGSSSSSELVNEKPTQLPASTHTLEGLVSYLEKNGFEVSEEGTGNYQSHGARDGLVLLVNGETVSFYDYDTGSLTATHKERLITALDTGKIDFGDGEREVIFNENLLMVGYETHQSRDILIKVFNEFKSKNTGDDTVNSGAATPDGTASNNMVSGT